MKDVYLSKEKQEDLTMALYDFFLECSGCVAMHVCEHPSLKRLCSKAGLPPLNRKRLAGPLLESRYAETVKQVDDRLAKQSIGVQMGTDGWKRKNVSEAQKIQNFIANFPDGGTQFLTAHNTEPKLPTKTSTVGRRRRWSFCAQLLMSLSLAMPSWTAFWLLNQDNVVYVTYLYVQLTNFDMQQVVR
ncbi:hypothetical protein ABBQ32_003084 [Trebouxia sp. C0010 RCD-2024]